MHRFQHRLIIMLAVALVGSPRLATAQLPAGRPPGTTDPVDVAAESATHAEAASLNVEFQRLTALRIRDDGSLLACDADAQTIKILAAGGQLRATIELPFAPEALDLAPDGTIYCGGGGRLAKLDPAGRLLKAVSVPGDVLPTGVQTGETAADPSGTPSYRVPPARRRVEAPPKQISGIAVSQRDVFVAFGSGWSTGSKSKLYRFDRELENPLLLAEGLRACCQRCDIAARQGVLYVAENAAHRVVLYDRDGNVLQKWGERGRDGLETFGACCNPMNICFDGQGVLYTAESGLGRVKRYTTQGEFIDLVGYVGTDRFWQGSRLAASCSNMAIAVSRDGRTVYVMDYKHNRIRVLERKTVVGDE